MTAPEAPVPLSAVGLRLTDEVGQSVLDWVAAGDLAASAALDQQVAAVRAALAHCQPAQPEAARVAGQTDGQAARPESARSGIARPHHARGSGAVGRPAPTPALAATACPDVPFADSAWHADPPPPIRLLLHYACGFVEASVRADWWPADPDATDLLDWRAMRLAAVCRLIRLAEASAVLPPDPGLVPPES